MSEEERIRLLDRRSAMELIGGALGGALLAGCGGGSGGSAASSYGSSSGGSSSSSSSSSGSSSSGSSSGASSSCAETVAKTEGPYWVDTQLNRSDIRTGSGESFLRGYQVTGSIRTRPIRRTASTTVPC